MSPGDKLLKEAVDIIHCHLRNVHKDFLTRARQHLRQARTQTTSKEKTQ